MNSCSSSKGKASRPSARLARFGLAALTGVVAEASLLVDVPGCSCDAALCGPYFSMESPLSASPSACGFAKEFEDAVVGIDPLCDVLQSLPDFDKKYGSGKMYGEYYGAVRDLPMSLRVGTCDQAYRVQDSCPVVGDEEDTDLIFSSTAFVSRGGRGCSTISKELPLTNTPVRLGVGCASSYSPITAGYDDELIVFVETGDKDARFCADSYGSTDIMAKYSPRLTGKDWIEPVPGRRYMCYEFRDPKDEDVMYNILLMSIGNAPCDGPGPGEEVEVPTTPAADAPTSAARRGWSMSGHKYLALALVHAIAWRHS